MDKAKLLFVYPPYGDMFGEIIDIGESIGTADLTTKLLPCHVAIFSNGQLLEAIVPTVQFSPVNKYDNWTRKEVEVDVPNLAAAEAWSLLQVGRMYSFPSCLEAEYFALTGKIIAYQDGGTMCSQLGIEWLRIAGLIIFGDKPSKLIRPSNLLNELVPFSG
jgi:hypothetical protein